MFDNPFDSLNENEDVFSYMAKERYSTVALFDLEKGVVTVHVNEFDPDTVGKEFPLSDYLLYMAESCRKANMDLSWFPSLGDMKDPDFTKSITKIVSLIRNEEIGFIKCEISPFGYSFDGSVSKVVYTTRDITGDIKEYDALIANINHQKDVEENYVDSKTGLFTMEYLRKILASISSTDDHIKYSLIKIDIRHFESVFEVFGTAASDDFANFLSKTLLKLIDRKSSILIHEYADSFYVLTESKKEVIDERMSIIRSLVQEYDIPIRLNMKCGVYHLHEKGLAPDIIINRAKMASDYIINDESVGICYYDESIKDEIIKKTDIKAYFHKAIKHREIELYYQPIYDTFTEKVAVMEALVRWNSPELGFVTPNMFIPVLEESGLIVKLDDYVLDRAFEDIRRAQARSLPVPVSINFSRPKIIQKGFADQLQAKLDRAGLEKSFIKIEVNEKALSASTDEVIRAVNELTAKGFIVAMDDFGSEDSSLNALKEFNISILKLDMKFFKNFDTNDKAKKIVEYAIKMAHAIGLRVVAEGVETKGQLDFLKKNGCEQIQGWYFAKAMPFELALKKVEEDGAHTLEDVNKAKRNLSRREEFLAKYRIEFSQKLILEFMSCANTKGNNAAINEMLKSICRYYQADRAYVFNVDNQNKTTTNIYEYIIPGNKRLASTMKDVPLSKVELWIDLLTKNDKVCINSIDDDYIVDSDEFKMLNKLNVDSFLAIPFYLNKQLIGYLGVDNPRFDYKNEYLLRTIAYFVFYDVSTKLAMDRLEKLSTYDTLTSVKNRNCYVEKVEELTHNMPKTLGALFCDLDDLKATNDEYGHEVGNTKLRILGSILKKIFPDYSYRVGGDEFVVLIPNIGEIEFGLLLDEFKYTIKADNEINVSVGSAFVNAPENIESVVTLADRRMYEDKNNKHNR